MSEQCRARHFAHEHVFVLGGRVLDGRSGSRIPQSEANQDWDGLVTELWARVARQHPNETRHHVSDA
jgi:hypothetical protein